MDLNYCFNVLLILTMMSYVRSGDCDCDFVQTKGTSFIVNGKPLYLNGFNSYWSLMFAADYSKRNKVTDVFREASKIGLNVVRIWAFDDGDYRPLQSSPGAYNEDVFRGLDFVVAKAQKFGIHMILSLVNNWKDYGGKAKYVEWANQHYHNINPNLRNLTEDDFYIDSLTKEYYKNHVKAVLTRNNTITGVTYKDDPSILAWELMNEPRCPSDPSGSNLQNWLKEMAEYVKSIDNKHLLEIGLEGFYGESKQQYNPNTNLDGTDFISNNQIPEIDFATIHLYPESWLPLTNATEAEQLAFVDKWIESHVMDSNTVLKKPIVISEFGKSYKLKGYTLDKRNNYFQKIYDDIYNSVRLGGPFVGGLFWQLMAQGMDNVADGYNVILEESSSTASIIAEQSQKLSSLSMYYA